MLNLNRHQKEAFQSILALLFFISCITFPTIAFAGITDFCAKKWPMWGRILAKIKICGDILVSECFKETSRYIRQKIAAVQSVTSHSLIASARGGFARHSSAFSGLIDLTLSLIVSPFMGRLIARGCSELKFCE